MGPQFFFQGEVAGSSFGEPNGKKHNVEVFLAEMGLFIRVQFADRAGTDLMFTREQAAEFRAAVNEVCDRVGIPGE